MVIGTTLFIVGILVVAIWVIIEIKRFKHKIFAVFLIALIIFAYLSFAVVLKDKDIDYKTIPGVVEASKIYYSWLGSMFVNFKTITTNAIHMDWKPNGDETLEKIEE